jgi:hypothetical protein
LTAAESGWIILAEEATMQSTATTRKWSPSIQESRRIGLAILGCFALATAHPPSALALCPDTPEECLGDASYFSIVTEGKLKLGSAFLSEDQFSYWAWSTVRGDLCADRLAAVSPPPGSSGGFTTHADNVAVLAASGVGVTAATVGSNGPDSIGLDTNLVATGGSLVGPRVDSSAVDTTGLHPLVERCEGAHADAVAAVATLAALPGATDLGNLSLAEGESRAIALAPGLNVFDAKAVRLDRESTLNFQNSGGGATWVVVRTMSLRTAIFGDINSSVPLLFVLAGKGPSVTIGRFSDLRQVGILAPARSVKVQGEGYFDGLWAKKAVVTGIDCLSPGLFGP